MPPVFCDFGPRTLLCCRPLDFGCLDDLTKFYQHKVVIREIKMINNFQIYEMVKGRWDRSTVYQIIGGKKIHLEGKSKGNCQSTIKF